MSFTDEIHALQATVAGQGVGLHSLTLVAEGLASGALVQPFEDRIPIWHPSGDYILHAGHTPYIHVYRLANLLRLGIGHELKIRQRGSRTRLRSSCSYDAQHLTSALAELAALAPNVFLLCYPNAGLPDARGVHPGSPNELAQAALHWARAGLVNIVGGCCGTTPAHIEALARAVAALPPRPSPPRPKGASESRGLRPNSR